MQGRSAALSRTFNFMVASRSSLVGSARGVPRIISALTPHAHRRRAAVDRVCRDQLRAASSAGEAATPVDVEFFHERSALAAGVAVVTKARASCSDRLAKHRDYGITQKPGFLERDRRRWA